MRWTADRDRLRVHCNLGKGGVPLLGISKVAEAIGFKTVGGLLPFEALATEAPLPAIVHWNQSHFAVVYRVKKHRRGAYSVFVADPGKGLVTYSKEEFCDHRLSTKTNGKEKGIALLLEPMDKFRLVKESRGSCCRETGGMKLFTQGKDTEQTSSASTSFAGRLKFLWGYLEKYKRYFTQLILGLLLGSLLQPVFPFLTQSIVDTGIGGKDIGFVWLVLLAEMMLLISRTAGQSHLKGCNDILS